MTAGPPGSGCWGGAGDSPGISTISVGWTSSRRRWTRSCVWAITVCISASLCRHASSSSSTFVAPAPTGWPQLGQYRLAFGSRCPQVAQLAISVAQRGGGALSQRPDLRAIVRVGDLPGAVVELELLQSVEGTVALFGTRQPPLLRGVRL